jgi:2-methylcitrate dehydratase PrpD
MPYALAVAALSGRATLDQFERLRSGDPEVQRLMRRVTLVDDTVLKAGEYAPLELVTTDGRRLTRQVPFAKGAPENPLSDAELDIKVRSLVVPVLGEARCRALVERVARLEELGDMRELMRLMVPEGAKSA